MKEIVILKNVLKRNAQHNGLPARKIPSVFQPSTIATRNAEPKLLAGQHVSHPKVVKLPLMLPNALKPKDAIKLNKMSSVQNNVLNKTVMIN